MSLQYKTKNKIALPVVMLHIDRYTKKIAFANLIDVLGG